MDGTFVYKFGVLGVDRGQINSPNGIYIYIYIYIAVDTSGLILVTEDTNIYHCAVYPYFIHCFGTTDGQFSSPCGIAVSVDEYMSVTFITKEFNISSPSLMRCFTAII